MRDENESIKLQRGKWKDGKVISFEFANSQKHHTEMVLGCSKDNCSFYVGSLVLPLRSLNGRIQKPL